MRSKYLRGGLIAIAFFCVYFSVQTAPHAGFIQTQRAQRGITITVNVTPGPMGYGPSSAREIALAHRYGRGADFPHLLAQATVQHAVPVEANVTPDPTATLFGASPSSVTFNVQAGNSQTISCAFQVRISTAVSLWTVDSGLSNDFSGTFNGTNLSNNTYLGTPKPTSTPFIVYPDNNNAWSIMDKQGGSKVYCVDLTLNVPITVLGGVYTTNAVYTLFY